MEKTVVSDLVLGIATALTIGGICSWANERHKKDRLLIEIQNEVIKFQHETIEDLLKDKKKTEA